MGICLLLKSSRRQLAFIGALLAGALTAPAQVFADVPPVLFTQKNPNAGKTAVVHKLLADAQKALTEGKVQVAIVLLRNAVSADPHNAEARVQLGKALLQANDALRAERELRQARKDGAPSRLVLPPLFQSMLARDESQVLLDLFPEAGPGAAEAPDILMARALAFQKLQRNAEAVNAMNRSLQLRRDADDLLTAARLSFLQKDYGAAGRFIDEVMQKWPDNSDAQLFKVELLLAERNNAGAFAMANHMATTFPANIAGRFARIETYLHLNQDAQAKAEIDSILSNTPDLVVAVYYRALLLARAGDAKGAWKVAQSLPSQFRDSNLSRGAIIAQMAINAGNADVGGSMLARILGDHPEQLAIRTQLAEMRLRQNGISSALNILEPVKDSTDPRVTRLYAIIYLQTHRPRQALDALRKLNSEQAANMAEKRALALLETQFGNVDRAIGVIAPAVAKEPNNPIVVEPYIDLLIQKRQYSEALSVADRYGSDPKQRAKALGYRGAILTLKHDIQGAQAAFDKAVANDPQNNSALFARASFLVTNQKYDDASRDLNTILSSDPKNFGAIMKLAEIAVRRRDDAAVRTLYNRAIALSPGNAAPRIGLAVHLISRQDIKGALAAAQGCVKAQPNNDDCVILLGKTEATLGLKKEAVASFRRLVSLRPELVSSQLLLSAALSMVGDRLGAARALDAAVELDPNAEAVRRAQIDFQISSGNSDAAVALARSFQSANPGTAADLLLAESLERAKHKDEAAAVLNKSLSERADSVVLMQLVRLALVSNDSRRASDLMSNWLASKPNDAAVRMKYATILLQQDESAKAIAQYQIVVRQEPNNIDALNNLSWLIQDSDPKRAQSLLTRALQLSPNSSHVADTLGWLKIRNKDLASGLALLNRAHSLEPDNSTITYHLIVALDANGKRGEARNLLKPLVSNNAQFADRSAALQLYSAWSR